MNSYVSLHGSRDNRLHGYVTSPPDKTQRSGYITIAAHTSKAGNYIDADSLRPAEDLVTSGGR